MRVTSFRAAKTDSKLPPLSLQKRKFKHRWYECQLLTQQVTFSSEYHCYKQGGQFNVPAHPVISLSAGSANEGNQLVLTVTGRTSQ